MKKTLIVLGCMSLVMAHAQQDGRAHTQHNGATTRVGINTEKPVASLEVSKVSGVPTTQVQGFLLPHLNQTERNAMQKEALTNGLMIFNTTKNCIDWWDGANWQCTDASLKDEHGDEFARYRATYSYTATTSFTRANCTSGQEAGSISYTNSTPIIGKGASNVSQADAQQKAEANARAEYNRLGQEYANQNATCRNVYRATVRYTHTDTFTRDNCTAGQEAGTVSYRNTTPIVREGVSYVSVADARANAQREAEAEFRRLGQEYANQRATCRNVYNGTFSYTGTKEFTKQCITGQIGSKVTYNNTIVGRATSYVSQEDANRLAEQNAKAEFDRLGQADANTRGTCKNDPLAECKAKFGNEHTHYILTNNKAPLDIIYKKTNTVINWREIETALDNVESGRYELMRMREVANLNIFDERNLCYQDNNGTLYKTNIKYELYYDLPNNKTIGLRLVSCPTYRRHIPYLIPIDSCIVDVVTTN